VQIVRGVHFQKTLKNSEKQQKERKENMYLGAAVKPEDT
jgi:hypothetical protein